MRAFNPMRSYRIVTLGSVAEWLNAPVLKTGVPQGIVSSNLTASANENKKWRCLAKCLTVFVYEIISVVDLIKYLGGKHRNALQARPEM